MNGIEGRQDLKAPTLRCPICAAFHAAGLPDDRQHRLWTRERHALRIMFQRFLAYIFFMVWG